MSTDTITYDRPSLNDARRMSVKQLREQLKARNLASGRPLWINKKLDLARLLAGEITELPVTIGENQSAVIDGAISDADLRKRVDAMFDEVAAARREELRPVVKVQVNRAEPVTVKGTTHKKFAECVKLLAAGIPVLLVGPTGSGKTHLCEQLAEAFGVRFTFNSMSEGISEAKLLGRVMPDADGNWNYRESQFIRTYRTGGLHLFDEVDASDPNLMVSVNAAIANGQVSVDGLDEPVERHADCFLVAAANTYGHGADRQYVGRNQLDAATLNRFTMGTVEIDYDRDVERSLVEAELGEQLDVAARLLDWGWKVREAIDANRLRRVMSTRELRDAAKRMAGGATLPEIKATYFLSWKPDEKRHLGALVN